MVKITITITAMMVIVTTTTDDNDDEDYEEEEDDDDDDCVGLKTGRTGIAIARRRPLLHHKAWKHQHLLNSTLTEDTSSTLFISSYRGFNAIPT